MNETTKEYIRDKDSKALLNTDNRSLEKFMKQKQSVLRLEDTNERINKLEQNLSQLNSKIDTILKLLDRS